MWRALQDIRTYSFRRYDNEINGFIAKETILKKINVSKFISILVNKALVSILFKETSYFG